MTSRPDLDSSYPSAPVTYVDVPEVRHFEARFVYNFFVPDESVTDVGINIDPTDADVETKFERSIPRAVQFKLTPVRVEPRGRAYANEFLGPTAADRFPHTDITENLGFVRMEHDLTDTPFVGVRFQDDNIDRKLYQVTSASVARRIDRHNRNVGNQFNLIASKLDSALKRRNMSLLDAAKLLSAGQGTVEGRTIVRALNQLREVNARFIDEDTQERTIEERFARVRNVGVDVQINSKFAHRALSSVVEDPISMFADEVAPVLGTLRSERERALKVHDAGTISEGEYETFADPIRTRRIDVASFNARRRIVGYIIDKQEVLQDGTVVPRDPVILQGRNVTHAVDVDIAYGRRYVYSVRSVAEIEFVATVDDDDELVAATVLISSKPTAQRTVDTSEDVPPPPPADFNVDWDRTEEAARITWAFPPNPQRDIKRFQLFRRTSIHEPFELIREFDFDDSVVRADSGESPSPELVHRTSSPVTFFIDHDFNRASKFIYTVACIDAHGLTSNYAVQLEARFDPARNDIVKRLVSSSGAPKPYPNMYVTQEDALVDVMRTSGRRQLDVYFDPEYLDVHTEEGRSLDLLAFEDSDGQYRMQFVNIDLQQGADLDILVKDRRTPVRPPTRLISVNRTGRGRTGLSSGRVKPSTGFVTGRG